MLARCPECGDQVTIPAGVVAEAIVRCPICDKEYPLADALASAPPPLVVVSIAPGVDLPLGDEAFGETDSDNVDDDDGIAVDDDGTIALAAEWHDVQSSERTSDFASLGVQESVNTATAAQKMRRKRRNEKNPVKEFAGVVIGGFLGLAVMYYALNFFGEPRNDWFSIWLPGVAHTEKHRPTWLGGQQGDAKPPAGQRDSNRPTSKDGAKPPRVTSPAPAVEAVD